MAAAITHDIIDYCMNNKYPVYICALDAEAAFDGIPLAIMFSKAIDFVPELCWCILVFWYSKLVVYRILVKLSRSAREPDKVDCHLHLYSICFTNTLLIFYQRRTAEYQSII